MWVSSQRFSVLLSVHENVLKYLSVEITYKWQIRLKKTLEYWFNLFVHKRPLDYYLSPPRAWIWTILLFRKYMFMSMRHCQCRYLLLICSWISQLWNMCIKQENHSFFFSPLTGRMSLQLCFNCVLSYCNLHIVEFIYLRHNQSKLIKSSAMLWPSLTPSPSCNGEDRMNPLIRGGVENM